MGYVLGRIRKERVGGSWGCACGKKPKNEIMAQVLSQGIQHFHEHSALPAAFYGHMADDDELGLQAQHEHAMTAAAEADVDDTDEDNLWYPVPCDDLRQWKEDLGIVEPQWRCFGCRYVGQNNAALIPDVRLKGVFELMANGIGVSYPPALAVEVSFEYERWRQIINQTAGKGKRPLPKWSPAMILCHWFSHTDDPQIKQWLHMYYCTWSMNKIRQSGMIKKHKTTGAEIHDREQSHLFIQFMKLYYFVAAKEPRKLPFFNDGAMITTSSVANNGLYVKDRPVYTFFRRTVGGNAGTGSKRKRMARIDMDDDM